MPLLEHFRQPVDDETQWCSFHSNWSTRLADQIAERLPDEFGVRENVMAAGGVEIDVASYLRRGDPATNGSHHDDEPDPYGPGDWNPTPPLRTVPVLFPDHFEVQVFRLAGGSAVVAAIELVSPANKDRPDARQAFARKVATYLSAGVSVIVMDVVTIRRANLHNELMRMLDLPFDLDLPPAATLYAAAYRPVVRDSRPEMDVWTNQFVVGDELPTMPLRLAGDLFIPVEFEAAYMEACRRRRYV